MLHQCFEVLTFTHCTFYTDKSQPYACGDNKVKQCSSQNNSPSKKTRYVSSVSFTQLINTIMVTHIQLK